MIMKPRILLINPWIHDFAAFNLWARPLGLLAVAEYLSVFDAELLYIDCADSFEPKRYGTGKYTAGPIPKPEMLRKVPRRYKQYGLSAGEFKARLKSFLPIDMVLMTSVMSYWYTGVQETIRRIRETAAGVPIVLGGIYPTLYPDHASLNSGADRIHSGPLKKELVPILREFGIALCLVRDPLPYYRLNLYSQYPFAPLLTSTGCPFHCSYCASRALSPRYERKSVHAISKEIQELYGQSVRDFAFYDDALLYDADHHIKPLLDFIIRARLDVRLHAPNGLHARFIDDELARLMRDSGFTTIRLSLETVDCARQEGTGGKVTNSDFKAAVRSLQRQGFTREHIGAYLLYGLPGQGLDEVEQGIAFLKRLKVRIHLAEFSPIRGTACWDDLVKSGIIPADLDPLLTNNTVFSFLFSGYDQACMERLKLKVKEYNRLY